MEVTIRTSEAPNIDWGATGSAEIIQNVFTLLNTFKYEVAYDRTLGIKREFVDLPPPLAVPLATADIYAVVEEREPRAKVKSVKFLGTNKHGELDFAVVIEI